MTLKFARSEKKKNFAELHKIIFSYPKTGKTTLAAHQKVGKLEPLFIATEDGHHELGVFAERVNNWQEFINLVLYIKKNEKEVKENYSCICIDLVSDLGEFCTDYICKQVGVDEIGDYKSHGAGYGLLTKEFKRVVNHLFAILPLTFITHAKTKDVTEESSGVVTKDVITPEMPKGIYKFLNGKCDVIGFIAPQTKKQATPVLTFVPSERIQAGSRLPLITKNYIIDIANMKATYDAIEKDMVA